MTNHDLARAAAQASCGSIFIGFGLFEFDTPGKQKTVEDVIARKVADTYASPMAELERLKRQVELCRKHGPVQAVSGHPARLRCTLCGKWNPVKPKWSPNPVHHRDCPHNEVAT